MWTLEQLEDACANSAGTRSTTSSASYTTNLLNKLLFFMYYVQYVGHEQIFLVLEPVMEQHEN